LIPLSPGYRIKIDRTMKKFNLLFNIDVKHPFFSDGFCGRLEFIPGTACSRLLKNTGALLRTNPRGLEIHFDQTKLDILNLYAQDKDDPMVFCFKVFSRDPYVTNYTDLASFPKNSVLFFDNRRAPNTGADSISLNQEQFVSMQDFAAITSEPLDKILSRQDRIKKPFFIVNIAVSEAHLARPDQPRHYGIEFAARKTRWKYFLLNELAKKNLYISDSKNEVEFEKLNDSRRIGEKCAVVFRSTTALPLLENSHYRFQLKEMNSGHGRTLINRLPVASPDLVCLERLQNEEITTSEIFINY